MNLNTRMTALMALTAITVFTTVAGLRITDVDTGDTHIYHAGQVVDPDDQLMEISAPTQCK